MKKVLFFLFFCLTFSITKGQVAMGIGINGGMPMNKSIQKYYSFAYGGDLWLSGTDEHRISYSGLTIGLYAFNKKKDVVFEQGFEYTDLSHNFYVETGLKCYVLNNFFIGVDVGVNWLYKNNDNYVTDGSITPQLSYSFEKIIFFEKTRFLLGNPKLSTINIGLDIKLF